MNIFFMKWITIDGSDGVGKTTIIELLREKLEKQNRVVEVLRAVGSGVNGDKLRNLYLNILTDKDDTDSRTAVSAIMHLNHIEKVKHSSTIDKDIIVISDRSIASFFAYNVCVLQERTARSIYEDILCNPDLIDIQPNLHLYITADEQTVLERLHSRGQLNHLDHESLAKHSKLSDAFNTYFRSETKSCTTIIDNSDTLEMLDLKVTGLANIL